MLSFEVNAIGNLKPKHTHVISLRATEGITTQFSNYSAGHEKPVSLTILLFGSQLELRYLQCKPPRPHLFHTLPDDTVDLRHRLTQQHSPPPHPLLPVKAPSRHRPYPTHRHHLRTSPPSPAAAPNEHAASIVIVDSSDGDNKWMLVPPPPPLLSVPLIEIPLPTPNPPPPQPFVPLNTVPIPTTTSNHVVEEDVSCSSYESDVDKILEYLQ